MFLRGRDPTWHDENLFRFVAVPFGTLDPKDTFFQPIYLPAAYLDTEIGYAAGAGKEVAPEALFRLPSSTT